MISVKKIIKKHTSLNCNKNNNDDDNEMDKIVSCDPFHPELTSTWELK